MVTFSVLPTLAVLAPALGALLIAWTGQSRANLRELWSVAAGVVLFGIVALMIPDVLDDERPGCVLFTLLPGIELAFRADAFGLLFASGAALLWILTSFYSIGYMRKLDEHAQTRYFSCFALALSATMGVAFAANLFTLFLFYEALTFVTYPLVSHKETAEAKAGARKYLIYLLGAAKLGLMAAIILTYNTTGTLEFRSGGIMTAAHVAEQPDAPLHGLCPLPVRIRQERADAAARLAAGRDGGPHAGERASPRGGSGQDRGLLDSAGLPLHLRPLRDARDRRGPACPHGAAGMTIVVGSLLALVQDNLKARLAFSTVSQLSYIILGGALLNASGVMGGIAHISNHAVSKITLFLCAGSIYASTHKTEINQLSGLAKRMPWTMAAFALASLSVVGIPLTCGFQSKWYLVMGAVERDELVLMAVLLTSSLLNAAYLFPIVYKAYFEKESASDGEEVREVPWMVAPLTITAIASLVLGIFPGPVLELAGRIMP